MKENRDPRFKHTKEKEEEIYNLAISGKYTSKYIQEKYECSYWDIVNIKRRRGYYDKKK